MQTPAWVVHESHLMDHQHANSFFPSIGKLTVSCSASLLYAWTCCVVLTDITHELVESCVLVLRICMAQS